MYHCALIFVATIQCGKVGDVCCMLQYNKLRQCNVMGIVKVVCVL